MVRVKVEVSVTDKSVFRDWGRFRVRDEDCLRMRGKGGVSVKDKIVFLEGGFRNEGGLGI